MIALRDLMANCKYERLLDVWIWDVGHLLMWEYTERLCYITMVPVIVNRCEELSAINTRNTEFD